VERILILFSLLGVGIFLLPDVGSVLHYGYIYWDSLLMAFGCYAIYHLTSVYWKGQHGDAYLMLLAGIPILVCGLHDILVVNHHLDARDGLIIQYSVVPALLLFSWFMIRRFVHSVNLSEKMTQTLEQQVAEKELALREQFKRLTRYEKEQALIGERERIMRDMHDGIGGQLVSLITLLDNHRGPVFERIRGRLHHSLADLRLVIDSLDPLLSDLPTLLGMMRRRLLDQMADHGIELEWCVTELPQVGEFSPRRSLHIMRIVQEAVTNSIKHANTSRITLATGVDKEERDEIYIDIIDYGAGMADAVLSDTHHGRGLKNMQHRAEQLGGTLQISSSDEGTCVRLVLV
jgi:signal transduction histidine kinase